jgi:hypothetical protein
VGTTHTGNGSANAAADSDSESDGVFAVKDQSDSKSTFSLPALLSTESDEDDNERSNFTISEEDWFSEVDGDDLPSPSDWEIKDIPQSWKNELVNLVPI